MKIFGFIFGLIIPFIALFLGLQISPTLANVLLTPIIYLTSFFDENLGNLPAIISAFFIFISGIFYMVLFFVVSKFVFSNKRRSY